MDSGHWPQEMGLMKLSNVSSSSSSTSPSMGELITVPSSSTPSSTVTRTPQHLTERRTRPSKEHALHCPRCNSSNTKFCYYNNYSLTQPRYFCKTCRRYWTEGGSLRNVPVGGGSRKNKKSTTTAMGSTSSNAATVNGSGGGASAAALPSSSMSTNVKKHLPDLTSQGTKMNPNLEDPKDFSLSFYGNNSISGNTSASTLFPAQEAAAVLYPRGGGGFGLPGFLSGTLNSPMDTNVQEGGGTFVFPFQDLTQISPAFVQNRGQGTSSGKSSGLWNGVMGGGASW